ncbi:MAG TPA: response regulator transcription factor [Candidatus Limnocylindrales bacterium]|nr:response regulator transcription factor [Candidatus Limnocylindrales bacterium]
MEQNLLLVEDEDALCLTLSDRLRSEGYGVECARDGNEGLQKATKSAYDLILLDVMLPKKNGFEVCREIRQAGLATPIIMLTARGETADKIAGLKIGADDYVPKPFDMAELMARIEALLRRSHGKANGQDLYQFGNLRVDVRGTEVARDGKAVQLSAREFQLLRYLIEHRGATVSRNEILQEVWGYSADTFTRTVDVHVASLRQKIEVDPKKPELIVTVPGLGYKFAG